MEIHTESSLILYEMNSKGFGWAFVIEFPNGNSDAYSDLEIELSMSNFLLLEKDQKIFEGQLGDNGNFLLIQNNFCKALRITSDKSFQFISNNFCLEGIILKTNYKGIENLYENDFENFLINVVLVFKNGNDSNFFIFPIDEIAKSKYRFLPTSQQKLDL